jgi:hypothetical protein
MRFEPGGGSELHDHGDFYSQPAGTKRRLHYGHRRHCRQSHSLSLSGIGLTSGSNAALSATSLTFGNQVVGTTSPAQSLTLSNYGTTTLALRAPP